MSRIDDILADIVDELKETMGETSAMYAAAGFVDVVASKLKEANERFESATHPVGDKVREEFDRARANFAEAKGDPRKARSLLDELPAVLLGGVTHVAGWVDQTYQDLAQRGRDVVDERGTKSGDAATSRAGSVPDSDEEPDDETPWGVVTPLSFIGKAASARAAAKRASHATRGADDDGTDAGEGPGTDDGGTSRTRPTGRPASRPVGAARTRKSAASVSRVVRGMGEGPDVEGADAEGTAPGEAGAANGSPGESPAGTGGKVRATARKATTTRRAGAAGRTASVVKAGSRTSGAVEGAESAATPGTVTPAAGSKASARKTAGSKTAASKTAASGTVGAGKAPAKAASVKTTTAGKVPAKTNAESTAQKTPAKKTNAAETPAKKTNAAKKTAKTPPGDG